MLDDPEPPPLDPPEEESDRAEFVRVMALSKARDLRAGLIHEYAHLHIDPCLTLLREIWPALMVDVACEISARPAA